MARKLSGVGVLIVLASLACAAPGMASTIAFLGSRETMGPWAGILGVHQDHSNFAVDLAAGPGKTPGTIKFSLNLPGIAVVSSLDFEFLATAAENPVQEGGRPWHNWETLVNVNYHRDKTSFTLTAALVEVLADVNQYVFITGFSFSMSSADPSPPSVPLPGTVWLLGAGLLGLACLRPHRSKIS